MSQNGTAVAAGFDDADREKAQPPVALGTPNDNGLTRTFNSAPTFGCNPSAWSASWGGVSVTFAADFSKRAGMQTNAAFAEPTDTKAEAIECGGL